MPGSPGYAASLENAGMVAAPLLAGFSATLTGLLLDPPIRNNVRWPDYAMFLFVAAAISFIGTVQAAVAARSYTVTPDELQSWYPSVPLEKLRPEQAGYALRFGRWAAATRVLYRLGVVAFLAGLSLLLVPKSDPSGARIAVVALAGAGLGAEVIWIGTNQVLARRAKPPEKQPPSEDDDAENGD